MFVVEGRCGVVGANRCSRGVRRGANVCLRVSGRQECLEKFVRLLDNVTAPRYTVSHDRATTTQRPDT